MYLFRMCRYVNKWESMPRNDISRSSIANAIYMLVINESFKPLEKNSVEIVANVEDVVLMSSGKLLDIIGDLSANAFKTIYKRGPNVNLSKS